MHNHEYLEAIRRALEAALRHPQEAVHPGLAVAEPRWAQGCLEEGAAGFNARPAVARSGRSARIRNRQFHSSMNGRQRSRSHPCIGWLECT